MRIAWAPVVLGVACAAGGLWLMVEGWGQVVSGVPGAAGMVWLGAGVLLTLLGMLMVVVPLLVPILFRLYGDDAFTSRGVCPVVSRCPRCSDFNFRGRPDCKACGTSLA